MEHYGLAPLESASEGQLLPRDEVWMVTHRMLREVPHAGVLWEALLGAFAQA